MAAILTTTAAIADWVAGPAIEALDADSIALVRRAFLDTIGVSLLGARLESPRAIAVVEFERGGGGKASVFGMGRKADLRSAALINGTSSHAELFDDNNAPMIAHPSSPLVSALLPLAQARRSSGRAVLYAYAAGFEVNVRLGRMLNPGLYERGWHVTRTLGLFGTTAACARLVGLDSARIAHALGIAASMTGGLRQNFGTMTMPLHVGLTSRDAIHAVLLAERGFESDPGGMDGKYGFFRAFAEQSPPLPVFGSPFELVDSGIIFKPFPTGAPSHAAIDAALALRERLGGQTGAAAIGQVTCFVHPWNAMTLRDVAPTDPRLARVNLSFCIAAALLYGRVSWREFNEETLADPALQALMRRIAVKISPDLPDNGEFPAEVHVETVDGKLLRHRSDVPPGGSTRRWGDAEVIAKLRDCAAAVLSSDEVDAVIDKVQRLEDLADVNALCESLEGPPLR